ALTAIAQIDQEDLAFAKDMVNATVSAMQADTKQQQDALGTLITLQDKNIVRLTDEENAVVKARQEVLTKQMDNMQKNADRVFDLIKDNTAAALKSGVSLADSPAVALSKMAPYMTKTSDLKTEIVDQGGKKVLINSETGAVIKEFIETKAPGSGTASDKYTDVVRADGSKIRVFLDSTGRPTGEEVSLAGADPTKDDGKKQAALDDAAKYVELLGGDKISWATAWNALKAKYPDSKNEDLDNVLNKTKYYKQKGKNA
ncbi:MAG: hypothetical protein NUV91_08245, partial [Candidatus Omnitrophica bacterium]|nr:hypothetical protein [Candidatus Omnitrophota bacterium]